MTRFYEILGVDKDADETQLKKAYRTLSLKHHPDRGGDGEKFKEINEAYETLSDKRKRQEYDMQQSFPGMGGMPFSHMNSMDEFSDINNLFNNLFIHIF